MGNFRNLALGAVLSIGLVSPAAAQMTGGTAGTPGTGNGTAIALGNRDENASYNSVVGKVGADPVGKEKAQRAKKAKAVPATAADIVAGRTVRDIKGAQVGTIESVDAEGAILAYSSGKIRYPLIGFGKDDKGLLINLTTDQFLALVAKASAGS